MFGLGGSELILIVAAALLVFGPSKLPQLARAIKAGYAEFRKLSQQVNKTVSELRQDIDLNLDLGPEDEAKAGAPARSASGASAAPAAPQLRPPEGARVGLRPPEPPPMRVLDNPLPVAAADDYLAPLQAGSGAGAGAPDDYLAEAAR